MSKRRDKFTFSATLEAAQVADYLVRIAEGLRRGVVGLSAGERAATLSPTAMLGLEIKAAARPEKASGYISLDLSWSPEYATLAQTLEITVDPREDAHIGASVAAHG